MDITLITCHFGDQFWVKNLLSSIAKYKDDRIREVIVVDQSRNSEEWLLSCPGVNRVLTFPIDEEFYNLLGHDHPASLNQAIRSLKFSTSHVLVIDSDCFPIRNGWLDRVEDVTLAGVPNNPGLSHSCFMLFPSKLSRFVDFQEGIHSLGFDTGRLVATQIARMGHSVQLSTPEPAFNGLRGNFYLGRGIYHHGSANFIHSGDSRLQKQVDPLAERIFRKHVEKSEYNLNSYEVLGFFLRRVIRTIIYQTKNFINRQ